MSARPQFAIRGEIGANRIALVVVLLSVAGGWVGAARLSARSDCRDCGPARDWRECPAIEKVDAQGDLYAMGDIHSDYERMVDLLVSGDLIDDRPAKPEDVQWSAGNAVLVTPGDFTGKWNADGERGAVSVIELLQALKVSARKQGGRVVVTMGNHEAEFLSDPGQSKVRFFRRNLVRRNLAPKEVAVGSDEEGVGEFLRCLPLGAKVTREKSWFFSHAGDTGWPLSLQELGEKIEKGVREEGFKTDVLLGKKGLLEARLKKRPWWEKKNESAEKSRKRLAERALELGVDHLAIGHQAGEYCFSNGSCRPEYQVYRHLDGLIFLLDVGMSRGVKTSPNKGTLLRVHTDGGATALTLIDHQGNRRPLGSSP